MLNYEIQQIVDTYVNKYTSAVMSDSSLSVEDMRCKDANNWLKEQCATNGISAEQVQEALKVSVQKAKDNHTACVYDMNVMK